MSATIECFQEMHEMSLSITVRAAVKAREHFNQHALNFCPEISPRYVIASDTTVRRMFV